MRDERASVLSLNSSHRLNTRSLSALEAGIDIASSYSCNDIIQYSDKHADAISYIGY